MTKPAVTIQVAMGSWAGLLAAPVDGPPKRGTLSSGLCPRCKAAPRAMYSQTREYRAYCVACLKTKNKEYSLRRQATGMAVRDA
jgi:hypothetical protein